MNKIKQIFDNIPKNFIVDFLKIKEETKSDGKLLFSMFLKKIGCDKLNDKELKKVYTLFVNEYPIYMYHITKKAYLKSILNNGLKINYPKLGMYNKYNKDQLYEKYDMIPIFLTTDPVFAIEKLLSKEDINMHNYCLLKVEVSGLNLEDEYAYLEIK